MWLYAAELLLGVSVALIGYHHLGYPLLLRMWAARARANTARTTIAQPIASASLPSVTLIVPAHDEAQVIEAKLANIAALDYPRDKLQVILAFDGCTDDTAAVARSSVRAQDRLALRLVEYRSNIGKVAVLNKQIAEAQSDVIALSDASAAVNADALLRASAHFADPTIGVVCGGYRLQVAGSEGESVYWDYQTAIKADEAAIAAPMGAHGAFYLFRRNLWTPLAADTINDDFVLPMSIVAKGYRSIYDPAIMATELERTGTAQEFRRRVRIGAGNMQQVLRLPQLADPRRGALALVFVSGKGLRPFVPFLALLAIILTAGLAVVAPGAFYKILFSLGAAAAGAVAYAVVDREREVPHLLRWLAYLVEGHAASGLGALRYLTGARLAGWQPRARETASVQSWSYLTPEVTWGKRTFDIVFSIAALALFIVMLVPIAIAIKLESPGPVLYRQRRVGRSTPELTETFVLYKFRSMFADAETQSGAVWASKDDPRITRVGNFLRKSRLDELPQCLNVLRGDMSIIGPRPERPGFFSKLEDAVPYYVERTFGIRPGITGLAQINLPYDESIDDVRMKCVYDHAYATHLTSFGEWFKTDIGIVAKTFQVMARGKGR